ncbi:glycosyltransferase family 4 protein [Krasilnikovia sp. MM14-A1259]|uniref:glycosyltransferase family 4 protein n=1 Tax=Krasilnikovia sp. MM14-A1259 TaxID=3373539 RepID=UPI0038173C12
MEIVQVVGLYPPHLGGQEVVVEQLAARQAESHQVTVYTSNLGAAGMPAEERHDTAAGGLRVVRQRSALIANVPVMPGLLGRLLRHRPKPDVLHVHTGQAMLLEIARVAARLRGIRYVAHQHLVLRPSTPLGRVFMPAYQRLLYARSLRRAHRVICLTTAMRDATVHTYGVDPARIAVIPNGVDPARACGEPVERRPDELLFIGRLTSQKNVGLLLAAVGVLRDRGRAVRVRIVGDGEDRTRLEAYTRQLHLPAVVFEGRMDADAVCRAYRRATALVMPSTHEGMPLVLLEAMASGTPVVATALREIREVGGDAVLTVADSGPAAFADALAAVLDDTALRQRLAEAGPVRAAAFGWPAIARTVDALYREVLG